MSETTRREVLRSIGTFAAVGGFISLQSGITQASESEGGGKMKEYTLPPLPYAYDALEPHIDKETLTIHHD